jgi:streptomycin 6-kinase
LKLCFPGRGCEYEIQALKAYNGSVMCRVIDSIPEKGILLLEHLLPGETLRTVEDDRAGTQIAAMLILNMGKLKVVPSGAFPTISSWANGLKLLRETYNGGSAPLPDHILVKAENLFPLLCDSQKETYLLHGDFHHDNILSDNGNWKLIDPKGVIGEMAYEVIPFLMNNLPRENELVVIRQRACVFASELQLDIHRIYAWGLCHSVLSAWWDIEDNQGVSDHSLRMISIFDELSDRDLRQAHGFK